MGTTICEEVEVTLLDTGDDAICTGEKLAALCQTALTFENIQPLSKIETEQLARKAWAKYMSCSLLGAFAELF